MNEKEAEDKNPHIEEAKIVTDEKSIVKTELSEETKLANFDKLDTVGQQLLYADVLIKSKLVPSQLNTPEKLVTVMNVGKSLGIPAPLAVLNIHNIEGKPTLSVHAIGALLIKAGITYKTIQNFETVYLKNDEGKIGKNKEGKPIVLDFVTTIRFERILNGKELVEDVSFTWKDAEEQGLTEKSNWVRMKKIMLWNRTLTLGARRFAPDVLMGMYEVSEIADSSNIDINLDSEGNLINDKI